MVQTEAVREALPRIIRERGIGSLLDAPCGDLNWIVRVPLDGVRYTGADIVEDMVRELRRKHAARGREFITLDIVGDAAPAHDLILCRDCLVHLSEADALAALRNFSRSGAKYLLTTTFPGVQENPPLDRTGRWRPLNLCRPPFNLPEPLEVVHERCPEPGFESKSLGLWRLPLPL
jgi:hypothetical protein